MPSARTMLLIVLAAALALLALAGSAAAESQTVFQDDFNDGTIDQDKWTVNLGAEDDACGANSQPNALRFSQSGGDRYAETRSLDVAGEGNVTFHLKYGKNDPCEHLDSNDEVSLQFSTDDGASWTTIATYSSGSFADFTEVTEPIPADAQTETTRFRWVQTNYCGSGCDEWAVDDVKVEADVRPCSDAQVDQGPVRGDASQSGEACFAVDRQEDAQTVPSQDIDTPGVPSQPVSTPGVPSQSIDTPHVPSQTVETPGVPSQTVETPGVPSQSIDTPRVPSQTVETPPVVIPEECTPGDVVCTERTEVLPAQHEETPEVPSQHVADTPPVPAQEEETPGVPSQHEETPEVPSQHVADTPPVPAQEEETPAVPSQHEETPEVGASIQADGDGSADSGHDEGQTVGPIDPDPVPIVICASGCDVPADPEADADPSAEVTVTVGDETRTVGTP